jgi:hypothetical protein
MHSVTVLALLPEIDLCEWLEIPQLKTPTT